MAAAANAQVMAECDAVAISTIDQLVPQLRSAIESTVSDVDMDDPNTLLAMLLGCLLPGLMEQDSDLVAAVLSVMHVGALQRLQNPMPPVP